MSDMTRRYIGFELTNMNTRATTTHRYIKGVNSVDAEHMAIRERAKSEVGSFMVTKLIPR